MSKPVLWFSAILGVVALLAVWLGFALAPARVATLPPPIADGSALPRPAPDISFSDASGNSLTLDDFQGRYVLLNLWATWCAPCVEEMPSLDRLQAALGGERFEVVALSIDRGGMAEVEPFYSRVGVVNLSIYLDPTARAPIAFGAQGLPTTYLIDPEGRIVAAYPGAKEWDSRASIEEIRRYLEG
ncbi:TlpA disulfide reductase family protein [Inquilinus sp. CAU 1745]|uniref:TlpA family protein disulfide reductase n=1 Tax=Inquilinus sp. CAU 1745 TaxID=3140369 RepID=UPI00325B26D7